MAGSNYVPQNNQIKNNRTRPLSPQPLFSDPVARDRGHPCCYTLGACWHFLWQPKSDERAAGGLIGPRSADHGAANHGAAAPAANPTSIDAAEGTCGNCLAAC